MEFTFQSPKWRVISNRTFAIALALCLNGTYAQSDTTATIGNSQDTLLPAKVSISNKHRETVNIAISDLLGKGVSQPEADLITEQVRSSVLATGTFKVMERSMMDQIMKEQGFQQTGGCDNSECMVSVGKILGVQNLVVGSVGRVGKIFMINIKLLDVSTGEMLKSMTETCECSIEQLLQETPKKVAEALDFEVRKARSGSMMVSTQPLGADVFLDEVRQGNTPWTSGLLDPGSYKISLVMKDWKRIDRSIEVNVGQRAALALSMERSDEWIASEKAAEEKARRAEIAHQEEMKRQQESAHRQKRLMWRIGLSALSALCVGGGYYFQTVADDNVTAAEQSYARYQGATDQGTMNEARTSTDASYAQADKARRGRNIAYGLGLAALSSITFTFYF